MKNYFPKDFLPMTPAARPRLVWQRLVYSIIFTGFLLILILGCQVYMPIFKNYQDSEVPTDQIATIDQGWHIDSIWEVKADQEKVLIWKFKKGLIYGNAVRQFKLKPGNYEIYIEDLYVGMEGAISRFRETWSVHLEAGHNYRVFYYINFFGNSYHWYWMEDLTMGKIVAGIKP